MTAVTCRLCGDLLGAVARYTVSVIRRTLDEEAGIHWKRKKKE